MITEEREKERVPSIQSLVKSSSYIGKVSQCQWHLNLNRVIHISNEVKVEGGVAVAKSGGVGKAPH